MKSKKICLLILILILVIVAFPVISNAKTKPSNPEARPPEPPIASSSSGTLNPDNYNPGEVTQSDVGQMATVTSTILAYVRNIGIIASVIILTVIGIKYMLGSLEQKADYKENMYLYVIGCFLLMMGATIPSIIYDIVH